MAQLHQWWAAHLQDRRDGAKGCNIRQSNQTDNESAKMAAGKGVVQSYLAVAGPRNDLMSKALRALLVSPPRTVAADHQEMR